MATHAPITGARTRAPSNVTRLPTAAALKVPCRHLTGSQLAERGIARILPTPDYVDPRRSYSAEMILAEAILAQLTPHQRRAAQNAVHELYHGIGTDQARAASAFMLGIR